MIYVKIFLDYLTVISQLSKNYNITLKMVWKWSKRKIRTIRWWKIEDDKLITTAIMKSILYLLFSFFERDICIEMYRSFRLGSIPYQCMYNVHMYIRPPIVFIFHDIVRFDYWALEEYFFYFNRCKCASVHLLNNMC